MTSPCSKFLKSLLAKGGQSAYVALLMLAAIEKNEKGLLKKVNISFIQSSLQVNHKNKAS